MERINKLYEDGIITLDEKRRLEEAFLSNDDAKEESKKEAKYLNNLIVDGDIYSNEELYVNKVKVDGTLKAFVIHANDVEIDGEANLEELVCNNLEVDGEIKATKITCANLSIDGEAYVNELKAENLKVDGNIEAENIKVDNINIDSDNSKINYLYINNGRLEGVEIDTLKVKGRVKIDEVKINKVILVQGAKIDGDGIIGDVLNEIN